MKATRKQQIKMVDSAFWKLAGCCNHQHEWDKYLALHEQEEREHRRFKPDFINCGLTKAQAVRLFAVKEIFERYGIPRVCICGHIGTEPVCPVDGCGRQTSEQKIFTPTADDYFHIRNSVFAACAIAKMCGDKIRSEFTPAEMVEWLATVDYCELNKDQRSEVAA